MSFLFAALVVLVTVLASQSSQNQNVSSDGWLGASVSYPTSSASVPPQAPSASVLVQVVGAVVSPGVFELPFGSRVLDAVFAAGGMTKEADQASINLARVVNDGEQVIVGVRNAAGVASSVASGANRLVNLNLADLATLDTLPGIGPTLAQRIIDYRSINGGFRSVSDLGRVAGIGANLLTKLKDLVSL